MALAQTQSKGINKPYLRPEGWRLLPKMLCVRCCLIWKTDNVFNERAALGEAIGIQNIRGECWPKLAKNWECL